MFKFHFPDPTEASVTWWMPSELKLQFAIRQSTVTADLVASKAVVTTTIRLRFDRRSTTFITTVATAAWINKYVSVTAASMRAGTDVLRLCDLNDCSRTAFESKWNRSCNHRKSSIHCVTQFTAE